MCHCLEAQDSKKDHDYYLLKLSDSDEEEDYGNQGIKGGQTILVECDGDEAAGMSVAWTFEFENEPCPQRRGKQEYIRRTSALGATRQGVFPVGGGSGTESVQR
jgi:hypothetical protein